MKRRFRFFRTFYRILIGSAGFRLHSPMLSAPSGAIPYGQAMFYARIFGGEILLREEKP